MADAIAIILFITEWLRMDMVASFARFRLQAINQQAQTNYSFQAHATGSHIPIAMPCNIGSRKQRAAWLASASVW